jgi:hypothetical protein
VALEAAHGLHQCLALGFLALQVGVATQQDDDEQPERVSAADLDALRGDLHAMLNDSDPKLVKGTPSHDRRNPRGCTRSDRTDLSRTCGSH